MDGSGLSRFRNSVNRSVATLGVKATSSLEKNKIRAQIDSLQGEIQKSYSKLGVQTYTIWESEKKEYSVLNNECIYIKKMLTEVKQLEMDIIRIDDKEAELLSDNIVIKAETKAETKAEHILCTKCGNRCKVTAKFCGICGANLEA